MSRFHLAMLRIMLSRYGLGGVLHGIAQLIQREAACASLSANPDFATIVTALEGAGDLLKLAEQHDPSLGECLIVGVVLDCAC